jgi:aspartate kinase
MIVYKFGGTSVGSAERIRGVVEVIRQAPHRPVVVVSALSGVTDALSALLLPGREDELADRVEALRARHLAVARELVPPGETLERLEARLLGVLNGVQALLEGEQERESPSDPGNRTLDAVRAAGEDLSVQLVSAALLEAGLPGLPVDARRVVRTDRRFGAAIPLDDESYALAREILLPLLDEGRIPVLQGYVGATADGETTTLGRGGSDFTAALVGAAIDAQEVTIWTDVDGIFSADPNQVRGARVLAEMGYEEAVELAWFGAKVIHPAAAKHAVARRVSLRIRNTLNPEAPGTLIRHDRRESPGVAAVAARKGVTLVKVRSRPLFMAAGFLARVFEVLARHRLPVDLVATSHTSTALTLDGEEDVGDVVDELRAFAEVEVHTGLATVSVVGRGLLERPGIVSRVFTALGVTPVLLISQASDVSLSLVLDEAHARDVVTRLHTLVGEAE